MRIAIATDAWHPQVNGVVRTLAATVAELHQRGYEVELITPEQLRPMWSALPPKARSAGARGAGRHGQLRGRASAPVKSMELVAEFVGLIGNEIEQTLPTTIQVSKIPQRPRTTIRGNFRNGAPS